MRCSGQCDISFTRVRFGPRLKPCPAHRPPKVLPSTSVQVRQLCMPALLHMPSVNIPSGMILHLKRTGLLNLLIRLTNLHCKFFFHLRKTHLISYPSTMEKKTVIHRYNLFNVNNNEYNALHVKIQMILYYAESRFWSILNHLADADFTKISWSQKLLHRELVLFIVLLTDRFSQSQNSTVVCTILHWNWDVARPSLDCADIGTITGREHGDH
jgi:hypothetical protein